MTRRVQHVRRAIDGDDLPNIGRDNFRQLPRSTSEVADDERRIDQPEYAPEIERIAEQIAAEAIPVTRSGREELLRLRTPPRQHAAKASIILPCCRCRCNLFLDDRPEPPRTRVELVSRRPVSYTHLTLPTSD